MYRVMQEFFPSTVYQRGVELFTETRLGLGLDGSEEHCRRSLYRDYIGVTYRQSDADPCLPA